MKKYTTIPQPVILSAVTKLEEYIKCTYGAGGRGIMIDNGLYQFVADDGFIALEEFELEDELENTVISYIKEGTRRTNKKAGDANTTFILIMCALVKSALSNLEYKVKVDFNEIANDLFKALPVAVKQIRKASKKVSTVEELEEIAVNAYKNKEIAKIVAEVVHKIGADGIISLEDSESTETTHEIVMGMTINKGYASPLMGNGKELELKNPAIIITDEDITQWSQIAPVVKTLVENGIQPAFLIADAISGDALNGALVNNLTVIRASGFAEQRLEILQDIAVLTRATVLSKKLGRPLSTFSIDCIGSAKLVTVGIEETKIVDGKGSKTDIEQRVEIIKSFMKVASQNDKKKLEERMAKLTGGVAVIKLGAFTDGDLRGMRPKVQNAINATKLAFKEGKILGGGVTLANIKSGSDMLDEALKHPREVLMENGKNYIDSGVYDSTGVLVVSLESAVSIAKDLITTGGIITNKKEKDE